MTTISQLLTTKPNKRKQNKNKLSKQLEQEQNHRNGDHVERVISGEVGGGERRKVQRISRRNGR